MKDDIRITVSNFDKRGRTLKKNVNVSATIPQEDLGQLLNRIDPDASSQLSTLMEKRKSKAVITIPAALLELAS